MNWLPDPHPDAYLWLAAYGGHAAIGAALWLLFSRWGAGFAAAAAVALFLLWEVFSAATMPPVLDPAAWNRLAWDSVLDTTSVAIGATFSGALWTRNRRFALALVVAGFFTAVIGAKVRLGA